MNPTIKVICAVATLGALAACAQPAPLGPTVVDNRAQTALTTEEVRGLIVGNTATGPVSGSHITFKMYVDPDGTAMADLPTGLDHGRWWLTKDAQLCFKWTVYRGGREYCERVYRDGSEYKFVSPTTEGIFTFAQGRHLSATG